MRADELALEAQVALQEGRLEDARRLFKRAVDEPGASSEHVHGLAAVELQLGEPLLAKGLAEEALRLTRGETGPDLDARRARLAITLAAASEDLDDLEAALGAYRQALAWQAGFPEALQGMGYLLLASGDLPGGLRELEAFVETPGPEILREGARSYIAALGRFLASETEPRVFLEAHRRRYVAFFDAMARKQEALGWIAEAARMHRQPDGSLVPLLAEGARPYAAVRVDLVDPRTGQAGLIGEQPMLVGVKGYEVLAEAPALLPWPGVTFDLRASTQAPWDQFPIQILLEDQNPLDVVDPLIGEWYRAGYDGAFGTREGGRFHYISDPERVRSCGVLYHVDLGRAEFRAIEDLVARLSSLHDAHRIARVVLGRGHLPAWPVSC